MRAFVAILPRPNNAPWRQRPMADSNQLPNKMRTLPWEIHFASRFWVRRRECYCDSGAYPSRRAPQGLPGGLPARTRSQSFVGHVYFWSSLRQQVSATPVGQENLLADVQSGDTAIQRQLHIATTSVKSMAMFSCRTFSCNCDDQEAYLLGTSIQRKHEVR